MGLPVICTRHPNQVAIVQQGIFVDMETPGALAASLAPSQRGPWREIAERGLSVAREQYDLQRLKHSYLERYSSMIGQAAALPAWTLQRRLKQNFKGAWRRATQGLQGGRSE